MMNDNEENRDESHNPDTQGVRADMLFREVLLFRSSSQTYPLEIFKDGDRQSCSQRWRICVTIVSRLATDLHALFSETPRNEAPISSRHERQGLAVAKGTTCKADLPWHYAASRPRKHRIWR